MAQRELLKILSKRPNTWFRVSELTCYNISSGSVCRQLKQLERYNWVKKEKRTVSYKDGGRKPINHFKINSKVYK